MCLSQQDAVRCMGEYQARVLSRTTDAPLNAAREKANKLARYAIKPELIRERRFEMESGRKLLEFHEDASPNGSESGGGMSKKSAFFRQRSYDILREMYAPESSAPDHIVHVTCTGYILPSAVQRVVSEYGWHSRVTHAYHMGCYAALPGVRIAQGYVATHRLDAEIPDPGFRADIVHTELNSLHVNPSLDTPEQTVVGSLFSDGSIKYSLKPPGTAERGFQLFHVTESIIPDTLDQMGWTPQDWGFEMKLGRGVPKLIKDNVREFVLKMCTESGWDIGAELGRCVFAVHPGGPRIIDAVQEALELTDAQVAASRRVLLERGNMSSATLPHVWAILADEDLRPGTPIFSLAFGPGLSVFGSLFRVI